MNVYAYMSLAAVAVNLLSGVYVLSRGPRLRLNRLLFVVLMTLAAWASGEFVMRTAQTSEAALRGGKMAGLGWCLVGPVYLVFVLAYTERDRLLRNPLACTVLFLPGLFFLVTLWTTDLVFKGFERSYWGYRELAGVLRLPSQLYVALLFITGIILLFNSWRRASAPAKRMNTACVLVASAIPVFAGLVTDIMLPLAGVKVVELTMLASTAVGPVLGYAIVSHGLMTTITGTLGSAIISSIGEAVFVTDADGLIETVNPAAEVLTGYTVSELRETPLGGLLFEEGPEGLLSFGPPGLTGHLLFCADKLGELIPVTVNTEVVRRRTGSKVGSVAVMHDMRDALRLADAQREAQEAAEEIEVERCRAETLRQSQEELLQLSGFLESVIDNITEPLSIKDIDGRYVFVNNRVCELAGLSREEFLGKTSEEADLMPPETIMLIKQLEDDVRDSGGLVVAELGEIRDPQGRSHYWKTLLTPLKNEAGEVEFIVAIGTDITEQKRLDRARLDFVRVAAHELRTPLTSLKLGLELLARETRGALGEEQRRSLDVLSLSIERLSGLAKNLLDLASLDSGLLTLNLQPVEIGPLVGEAVVLLSNAMDEKGLYCDVAADGDLRRACADPGRLSQVLYNLLSNAVKYTETGGITISARDPGDGLLEVCVADTGAGIPRAHQESIFTSFVREHSSDGAGEGTGLGLSIVRAIVEAHGGSVWVESAPGTGSKFFFTLRAAD